MSERRYIAPLDGLRTLAVLSVIGYHLGLPFAQGGLLGVTVFFVLSGYLITGLLVAELDESGTVKLGRFWLRRVRRLLPAILCVVAATCGLCALFNHVLLTKMRPDILPSLFWMQNWWYILRDMSYFEALGAPSPLVHFWSLAIEEQFYLVWPLCLLAIYKLGGRKRAIRLVCLLLAVASALWMALLYNPLGDPTRVYYGTDTRAFSLLLGAALSTICVSDCFSATAGDQGRSGVRGFFASAALWDVLGITALLGLLCMMAFIGGTDDIMYYGGLAVASVLTMALMVALVHERTLLAKVFGLKPLVWMGQRSYGMYLWHFPLILLLAPIDAGFSEGAHSWWFALLVVVATTTIAAVQYKFVEDPIRHGALGTFFKASSPKRMKAVPVITSAVCSVVLVGAVVGVACVPDQDLVPQDAIVSTGAGVDQAMDVSSLAQLEAGKGVPADAPKEDPRKAPGVAHQEGTLNPILLGDSVPALVDLEGRYPYSLNDSMVSRWTYQAIDILEDYANEGVVGHVVVFACFSNHSLREGELERLHELVGPQRELFLVTTRTPNDYSWENNDELWEFATPRPNVHIVDWAAFSEGHEDEWLYGDGTHLRDEGQAAYLDMISSAIDFYVPDADIAEA